MLLLLVKRRSVALAVDCETPGPLWLTDSLTGRQ